MDMKLEVVVVPVSDVDRAKAFYESLGWRLDADFPGERGFRVVQLTPPGSACSIIFGSGVTSAAPGSADGLQLVVTDIEAARAELVERGVEVSEVFHDAGGVFHHAGTEARAAGPGSRAQDLWVVCLVQRSGRQRLVPPRGDDSPSGRDGERTAMPRSTQEVPRCQPPTIPPTIWPPLSAGPRMLTAATKQEIGHRRPGLAGLVRAVHGGRAVRAFGPGRPRDGT